jgi:hypothetical protein
MSRRQKIIIAIVVLLLLLLLVFLFLSRGQQVVGPPGLDAQPELKSEPGTGLQVEPTDTGRESVPLETGETIEEVTPPPEPDDRTNVLRIASAFAERFGSFSNQSDFENILDLKVFMTSSMADWADSYVEDARESGAASSGEYFGVTTRSVTTELLDFNETSGTAKVQVNTQRSERRGAAVVPSIRYQTVDIEFRREGDIWKVDSAVWQTE